MSDIKNAAALFIEPPSAKMHASAPGTLLGRSESMGATWLFGSIAHYFGNDGVTQTADAIEKARAAGVPWLSIFSVILPLILQLFSGGGISLQAILDAIMALIKPKPPTP
jgi:hypothetical protein